MTADSQQPTVAANLAGAAMRYLLIAALVLAAVPLAAQHVTLLGGPTWARVAPYPAGSTESSSLTTSTLPKLTGGGEFEWSVSQTSEIAVGGLYLHKGARSDPTGLGSNASHTTLDAGYIEVFGLWRGSFIPISGSHLRILALAGPSIGFRNSCSYTTSSTMAPQYYCSTSTSANSRDFSVMIGGGLRRGHVAVTMRGDFGFTPVRPAATGGNRVIMVLLELRS